MADYVNLTSVDGQTILRPVTDLAAINMTTVNGIAVNPVNGGTIGIVDGYIESRVGLNMYEYVGSAVVVNPSAII